MRPFFDLQHLEEISSEQLVKDVKASKAVVTVCIHSPCRCPICCRPNAAAAPSLDRECIVPCVSPRSTVQIVDPETFTSEWVLLENQTAADNNIPIIPFYDGDRWKWNDISFWVSKYPQFFKIPAIEYHRTYHKQSKALLVSKAKGQKRFSEQLVAPNEVVATAAQKLAVHMEELLTTQILPPQCAKLCRATSNLHDEAGSLAPELVEDAGVDSSLAELRSCVEDTQEIRVRVRVRVRV